MPQRGDEPGLAQLIAKVVEKGTFKATDDISAFRDAGVTILLVSHSAATVLETCTRALWLDHGRLVADGEPLQVVTAYDQSTYATTG